MMSVTCLLEDAGSEGGRVEEQNKNANANDPCQKPRTPMLADQKAAAQKKANQAEQKASSKFVNRQSLLFIDVRVAVFAVFAAFDALFVVLVILVVQTISNALPFLICEVGAEDCVVVIASSESRHAHHGRIAVWRSIGERSGASFARSGLAS